MFNVYRAVAFILVVLTAAGCAAHGSASKGDDSVNASGSVRGK